METLSKQLSEICRTCTSSLNNTQPVYSLQGNNKKLADMLMSVASLQICENEALPSSLCSLCFNKLNSAYKFKKQCQKTEMYLKMYFGSLVTQEKDVFISEYTETYNVKESTNETKDRTLDKINESANKCIPVPESNELPIKQIDEIRCTIEVNHKCKLCNESFTQLSLYQLHMEDHGREIPDTCTGCPKGLMACTLKVQKQVQKQSPICRPTGKSLIQHKSRCNIEKRRLCCICGKMFGSDSTLQIHMRVHSGDKPLKCPICPKSFAARAGLALHQRTHSGERPFLCPVCGKCFKASGDLTVHNRRHTGERPHTCETCNKSFRTSYMLVIHRRCHTGEKPHHCRICKKSFTSNGNLHTHMISHVSIKPHVCGECNRAFSTAKDLNTHSMIHSGKKPYACSKCDKTFNRANNRAKHMKVHFGIKTHVCEVCKFAFYTSTELKIHVRRHTGHKPYTCVHCKKAFVSSSGLTRHKRRHKDENSVSPKTSKTSKCASESNSSNIKNQTAKANLSSSLGQKEIVNCKLVPISKKTKCKTPGSSKDKTSKFLTNVKKSDSSIYTKPVVDMNSKHVEIKNTN